METLLITKIVLGRSVGGLDLRRPEVLLRVKGGSTLIASVKRYPAFIRGNFGVDFGCPALTKFHLGVFYGYPALIKGNFEVSFGYLALIKGHFGVHCGYLS